MSRANGQVEFRTLAFQFKSHFTNVPTEWSIEYGQMERAVLFVCVVQGRDAYSSSACHLPEGSVLFFC